MVEWTATAFEKTFQRVAVVVGTANQSLSHIERWATASGSAAIAICDFNLWLMGTDSCFLGKYRKLEELARQNDIVHHTTVARIVLTHINLTVRPFVTQNTS